MTHNAESGLPALADMPLDQRDEMVAQVWAFLTERGYRITHPAAESDALLGDDVESNYVVLWFPPEGDRARTFGANEAKARAFAATEDIAKWNPLMVHRITITTEELLPLGTPTPPGASA